MHEVRRHLRLHTETTYRHEGRDMTKDIFDDVGQMSIVHLDCFTVGLDDLTEEQQKDHRKVLEILDKAGMFSVFEATDNEVIANTMTELEKTEMIKTTREGTSFPWLKVELTEKAKAFLAEQPTKESKDAS